MMSTRIGLAVVTFVSVAVATELAAHAGSAAVLGALSDVGLLGLVWVCVMQFVSLSLCGAALWLVSDGLSFGSCLTARWIRDGASNLIAVVPGIGEIAGARAMALFGAGAGIAAASTVVDVAIESLSQALYTLIGLIPLFLVAEHDEATRWLAAMAVASVPVAAVYLVTRHQGALGAMERVILRVARAFHLCEVAAELNIARNVHALYGRQRRIALALAVHLAAWMIGAVQVWAAAQAMDRPLSLEAALALESLVYAARGALFVVPWGAGVQEGGFVFVGAVLGLDAAGAIALSLVLRARDALLGTPAVLLWYAAEGRERWINRTRFEGGPEESAAYGECARTPDPDRVARISGRTQ
jgi:putative membrane protein